MPNYPTIFKHYETKSKKWAWFECAMCDTRFMEEYQTEEEMWDIDTCAKCNPEYQAMLKEKGY